MLKVLEVRDLYVSVSGKMILKKVNLEVRDNEVVVVLGPNGSGKTTLINAIMGIPGYNIVRGDIRFMGRSIKSLPIDERARLGIGIAYQRPPPLRGVSLKELTSLIARSQEDIVKLSKALGITEDMLSREVNREFSGGEIKRTELLQLLLQKPKLALLDEPDSGVDVESISLIGKAVEELVEGGTSVLLITHLGSILKYIPSSRAYVIVDGTIVCEGDPIGILRDITKYGFEACYKCKEEMRG